MRHHRRVAGALRHVHGVERLGQRADLVDLDQDRIGDALLDALASAASTLVTNRSSPTSWHLLAERFGQRLPAVPVVLRHAVLDRDDRIARRPGSA